MKILCLANSYKTGGRCLAGIELDENNQPKLNDNFIIWIRPVGNPPNFEIPTHLCQDIQLLDIFTIENPTNVGKGFQSENTAFEGNPTKLDSSFSYEDLEAIIENSHFIRVFENSGNAVHKDRIIDIDYSLKLLSLETFNVIEREYEGKEHSQKRLSFEFNSIEYNFPISDPVFLDVFKETPQILEETDKIYVTLSLAVLDGDFHSKLVAAIFYE